uniref:Proteinase inhibitor II n=1 Tax=Solanum lycopersicum TaxID=4081 RepID=I3QHE9_SOLLC|nr:proteinase inhibitor II [Solanum lycopersicum]
MAVHKEVYFVAYRLIVLGMFLYVDAKACTRECGNLGFGICPRSEEKVPALIPHIAFNWLATREIYNSFGKFICEGESDPKRPNACTFNCDPNIAYSRCPRSQGKSLIYPTGCTTCCTGYKGCYYFGKDGKFVCEGESDEPKANMYPVM